MPRRPGDTYPFSAIVGQETLKTALLLNAVDPLIGGVLVRGERGTAKSTAVRALAEVLPGIQVVAECRFGCDPSDPVSWCDGCRAAHEPGKAPTETRRPRLVDLPVSATEDRVVGTIDIERALKGGERVLDPGLLADANRGILYVDEVNLLDDHLVDTLLDSAATGVSVVEREGVRHTHPARFVLVGTMNPEEGDVRPQLLDRFGLCVDVRGISDPEERVEIVRRRRAHDEDATAFLRRWENEQASLETRLHRAQLRLPTVAVSEGMLMAMARLCVAAGVDGHRADVVLSRGAVAHAALGGRGEVTSEDVRAVAALALAHRARGADREELAEAEVNRLVEEALPVSAESAGEEDAYTPGPVGGVDDAGEALELALVTAAAEPGAASEVDVRLATPLDRERRTGGGRRQTTIADDSRGRYVRASIPAEGAVADVAVDASVRAAAIRSGRLEGGAALKVELADVRAKVRRRRVGATVVFCVDASGSMSAARRMECAKAAVLELLDDAYKRRDRVGLVAFRGDNAELVLSPTSSVEVARTRLREVKTGGATPLAHGIHSAMDALEAEVRRNKDVVPWLVLVTDGRANVPLNGGLGSEDAHSAATRVRSAKLNAIVIDTNPASSASAAARELARTARAEYVRLDTLDGSAVAKAVRGRLDG